MINILESVQLLLLLCMNILWDFWFGLVSFRLVFIMKNAIAALAFLEQKAKLSKEEYF